MNVCTYLYRLPGVRVTFWLMYSGVELFPLSKGYLASAIKKRFPWAYPDDEGGVSQSNVSRGGEGDCCARIAPLESKAKVPEVTLYPQYAPLPK